MTLLHHEIVEAGGAAPVRQLLVLHGIYGAGRNWRTVARRLVRARPRWRCVLVDLRSHGRSPSLEPHTLEACAGDLARLEDRIGAADAVLGHSFGGKVAMMWARGAAARAGAGESRRAARLWIVDSSPGAGPPRGGAWRMLGVLRRHPGPFGSRAEAVAAVEAEGFSRAVAQWMAINLVRGGAGASSGGGEFVWRIDPEAMEALIRDYFRHDLWRVVEAPPPGLRVHVVRAAGSSVLAPADAARIRRARERTGRVALHEIEGGHWVNVENPDALHGVLAAGLGG